MFVPTMAPIPRRLASAARMHQSPGSCAVGCCLPQVLQTERLPRNVLGALQLVPQLQQWPGVRVGQPRLPLGSVAWIDQAQHD